MSTLDRLQSEAFRLGWSTLKGKHEGRAWWQASYGRKWIRVEFDRSGGISRVTAFNRRPAGQKTAGKAELVLKLLVSAKARGTSNANERGNSAMRRARKQALLARDGDGTTATCSTCPTVVTYATATVDRWPLSGADGGTYGTPKDLSNVRLQCAPCASAQGGEMGPARKRAKAASGELGGLRDLLRLVP